MLEVEIAPATSDLTGTELIFTYGSSNGFYLYLANGQPNFQCFFYSTGPAVSLTTCSTVLDANVYCRLRVTKTNDNYIHIFRWRNNIEGWVELPYVQQANTEGKCLNFPGDYFFIGGNYNNTSLYGGLIGECKYGIGAGDNWAWLNGDGIADQRPMYAHWNLGDRIVAKKHLSNGVLTGADNYQYQESTAVMLYPGAQTALVAAHDQLLKYKDVLLPQGKKIAAQLQLSRVSSADAPAVQGFLLNYQKQ